MLQNYQSGAGVYYTSSTESEIRAEQAQVALQNLMKANERAVILALVRGVPMELSPQKKSLQPQLDDLVHEIKAYVSNTLTGYVSDAYEGKGAEAAKDYLNSTLKKPTLENPMRNC